MPRQAGAGPYATAPGGPKPDYFVARCFCFSCSQ